MYEKQANYRNKKREQGFIQKTFWVHKKSFEAGMKGDSFLDNDPFSYKIGQLYALKQDKESEK